MLSIDTNLLGVYSLSRQQHWDLIVNPCWMNHFFLIQYHEGSMHTQVNHYKKKKLRIAWNARKWYDADSTLHDLFAEEIMLYILI